jgi:hypothetical protein
MNIYNANTSENATMLTANIVQRDAWESIYSGIVEKIESHERIQDKHDFVLALYSASLKLPTSGGKISDQIVMNRVVFPYLEKALQHYGIAKRIVAKRNEDGSVQINQISSKSWTYRPENGEPKTFSDPLEYQKFHSSYSGIVHTTSTRV